MKVNYVKTKGFRKFKEIFETDLYNITNITGKNKSGKSNLLYAIINIMLGTGFKHFLIAKIDISIANA